MFLFVAVQTFVYPFACLCLVTLYINLDLFQLVLYLCSSRLLFSDIVRCDCGLLMEQCGEIVFDCPCTDWNYKGTSGKAETVILVSCKAICQRFELSCINNMSP